MSVAAAAPPIERYRLTSAIFHEMVDKGILSEDIRLELIEGGLVTLSPPGAEDSGIVNQIAQTLIPQIEQRALFRIHGPIALDEFSEPQPDLALLVQRDDFYKHSLPRPADVALVIEVADSSLAYDRTIKMPLYARAGVPMLPVVAGDKATRSQIWLYSLLLAPLGLTPAAVGLGGPLYLAVSAVLGVLFLVLAWQVRVSEGAVAAKRLFAFSILYLFLLFALLLAEPMIGIVPFAPVLGGMS